MSSHYSLGSTQVGDLYALILAQFLLACGLTIVYQQFLGPGCPTLFWLLMLATLPTLYIATFKLNTYRPGLDDSQLGGDPNLYQACTTRYLE